MQKKEDFEILSRIGNNLRHYRLAKNLSQERLEVLADISKNTIGGIERCETHPGLLTFLKITQILEISLNDLIKD